MTRSINQHSVRILLCCSSVSVMPPGFWRELLCLLIARILAESCPFDTLGKFSFYRMQMESLQVLPESTRVMFGLLLEVLLHSFSIHLFIFRVFYLYSLFPLKYFFNNFKILTWIGNAKQTYLFCLLTLPWRGDFCNGLYFLFVNPSSIEIVFL